LDGIFFETKNHGLIGKLFLLKKIFVLRRKGQRFSSLGIKRHFGKGKFLISTNTVCFFSTKNTNIFLKNPKNTITGHTVDLFDKASNLHQQDEESYPIGVACVRSHLTSVFETAHLMSCFLYKKSHASEACPIKGLEGLNLTPTGVGLQM